MQFNIIHEEGDRKIYEIVESGFNFIERKTSVKIPRRYVKGFIRDGDFGSIKWYIQNAYNHEREQVSFPDLWKLFNEEPWQREDPHYEFVILESDLYAPRLNFVFGGTIPKITPYGEIRYGVCGTVISVYRYKKWYSKDWPQTFFGAIVHELGHFHGLSSSENPNFIRENDPRAKSELDYEHCDNPSCIMEQVHAPGRMQANEKIKYLQMTNPDLFCKYDLAALQKNVRLLYSGFI